MHDLITTLMVYIPNAVNEWYLCLAESNPKSNTPQVCSTNGENDGQLPRAASRELWYRVPFRLLLLNMTEQAICHCGRGRTLRDHQEIHKSLKVLRISTGRGSFLFVNSAPVSVGASDASQSLCPHQCGDPQTITAHQDITKTLVMDE
ncbi:unnamed protein product [Fusarium venenatum]|uniref:Uncharacterized protein n=1 Tax=Fusarium venenatum TaxID=56646 RepID=A0A2L2T5C4_9HYPO|nr:uncharacterized protein FVRRES_01540 [Fusarium venenatum]CEI65028.1 unnamed protein product [Fusarium venenatum]